ncbi:MAG: hypothetical protein PVF73_00050 [Bacteroidales bacterium]|jgi:hypothetical protein
MKNSLIVILLLTVGIPKIFSQKDTVFIIRTDTVFVPEKKDLYYKSFLQGREKEVKHLWKLNLTDLVLVKPNIGLEWKIGRSFSSDTYLAYGFDFYPSFFEGSGGTAADIRQQFKYYYNFKRRERMGKRVNGFSGNYVSVILFGNNSIDGYEIVNQGNNISVSSYRINYGIGLRYGLQRRIGNMGYIEPYIGINYQISDVEDSMSSITNYPGPYSETYRVREFKPCIGLKAGFAISSVRNLKKVVKN